MSFSNDNPNPQYVYIRWWMYFTGKIEEEEEIDHCDTNVAPTL